MSSYLNYGQEQQSKTKSLIEISVDKTNSLSILKDNIDMIVNCNQDLKQENIKVSSCLDIIFHQKLVEGEVLIKSKDNNKYLINLDLKIIETKDNIDLLLNIGTIDLKINDVEFKLMLQIVKEKDLFYKHIILN